MASNKNNKSKKNKKNQNRSLPLWVYPVVLLALLVVGIVLYGILSSNPSADTKESSTETPTEESSTKAPTNEEGSTIYADITVKDYGKITVVLDPEAAPISVANFVSLAESGFYDGLTFHRIKEGFMIQGGRGNENSPAVSVIKGEFSLNGVENPISHTRGVISMARATDYNSATSQFFIMHKDTTSLDGRYAGFGHVVSGMEVVDAIAEAANPTDNNGTIPDDEQPIIESIKIRWENENE